MRVENNIFISRNPEEVFAYISEIENHVHFISVIKKIHKVTPGKVRIGTVYSKEIVMLGKEITVTYEIVELNAPKVFMAKVISGNTPITEGILVEPFENGSKVTFKLDGSSGGGKFADAILRLTFEKQVKKDLKNLKENLEKLVKEKKAL